MKENKKAKKVVALLLCAVLLVVGSVTGTMAYLTSQDTVTNTFTVGNVEITLDETDVDLYGVKDSETRVDKNTYKLIPGHTYVKDPVIHVASGSEACYLFVKVENGISGIEGASTIASQMTANGWVNITGTDVYKKEAVIDARNEAKNVAIFETFTIANAADVNLTDTDNDGTIDAQITITAYAIQADGFTNVDAAWAAAPAAWKS